MKCEFAFALLFSLHLGTSVQNLGAQPSFAKQNPTLAATPEICLNQAQVRASFQKDPQNSVMRSAWGRVLVCLNRIDEALALHREAISQNPNNPSSYQDLADVLVRQNQLDAALAAFRKAFSLMGHSPEQQQSLAYEALGNKLVALDKLDEALNAYQEVVTPNPMSSGAIDTRKQASSYRKLGTVLVQLHRTQAALTAFRKAVALDPVKAQATASVLESQAYLELANALRQQADFDSAKVAFKAALELEPVNAEIYYALGEIYLTLKQPEEAISNYRALLKQNPQDVRALLQLGEIFTQQNQLSEAMILFRQVIALHPLDYEATAQNGLGMILIKQNKPTEAIAAFRKAVQLHPGYADAFSNLGDALVQNHQPNAALAAYQPFLNLYKDAEVYNYFGDFLSKHKALASKAIGAYRKAIALDANFTPAYIGLGKVLTQQQQFEAAIKVYQTVINIIPSAKAYHGLALALIGQNKLDEAIAALKQAIDADFDNVTEARQTLQQVEALKKASLRKKQLQSLGSD
jgi:tetratricopeptide (TPR) repeat protein